ncbi:aromatic amino acid transport family protein [Phascolarctobacterium faecium]|uniref:aromatic amino acid transport family protein n=1 Tax=Phascolarctobacterium faecium TaxID=33025 RepID=UPI003AABA3D4
MKSENNIVEGALKVHKLTFWEAAMIIVGANIGSGILGLAYSARKAGWPVLMLWLIIAGFFTTASMLYVAETTLRTRKVMQLPGLAKKYVGELGAWLVFISVAANTIGCLIAYTNGSGRILSEMFGLSTQIGSLLFSVPAVIVVWFGLKATGVAEKVISFGMMALLAVIIAASFLSENSDLSNAIFTNWTYAIPVFNVAIFCYIAQYAVPELARGLAHDQQKLAPAIVTGMSLTMVLLALVPLAVLSLTGPENVTQVATIAWGKALGEWAFFTANLFALAAMMTSYWAVAGSFLTNIVDKFNFKSEDDVKTRLFVLACVVIPPFILAYSGLVSFVDAIYLAGTFGGVIMSVLPVLMLRSARKTGDMEPSWQCGWIASAWVQWSMIVLFCGAALYAVLGLFGLLPAAW